MSFVNLKKKEIQVKIVYYGPGRGGKTTNLEYVFKTFRERALTNMVSIKTAADRTLFFDFLPFDLGKVHGYDVRVQLYTVPGQVRYNGIRRMVLTGVDGIVFVADSLAVRKTENIHSLENLQENLASHKKTIFNIPLVFQYNKRDLAQDGIPVLGIQELDGDLNSRLKAPYCEASALTGTNVVMTMKKIVTLTMASVLKELKVP